MIALVRFSEFFVGEKVPCNQELSMLIISVRAASLKLILIVDTAAEQSESYEKQSAMKMLIFTRVYCNLHYFLTKTF